MKMKRIIVAMLLVSVIFFAGCSNVDLSKVSDSDIERISDKVIECNEPYIRFGTSCCLDKNKNNICDNDETEENLNNDTIINESIDNSQNSTSLEQNQKIELTIEEGANSFRINNKEYTLQVGDIFPEGLYKVKLNSIEDTVVDSFEKTQFNGLYLFVLDTIISSRPTVKSYAEIIITNYDYDLQVEDVKECRSTESGGDYEDVYTSGTTFGLNTDQDQLLKKKDYCSDVQTLVEYFCDEAANDEEYVSDREVVCDYGCENGKCLSIVEVGCDKDPLTSGIKSLGEGEKININDISVKVLSVGEGVVELEINGDREFFEMCKKKTVGDLTILIDDTISSARENVAGYIDYSFDYKPVVPSEPEEPLEPAEANVSLVLGDGEVSNFTLAETQYTLEISKIHMDNSVEIKIDSGSTHTLTPYEQIQIGDVYVVVVDVITSARASVKGYAKMIVSNYDYELNPEDVSCYDTDSKLEQKYVKGTTYGLSEDLSEFLAKTDYCSNNNLIEYNCYGEDEEITQDEINCEYGCNDGRCLNASEVESKEYVLTDEFNFWEDQSSHNYQTQGTTSSGASAYRCETTAESTLRLSNCAIGETGSVSLDLDVNPGSESIIVSVKEGVGYNDFKIELDGIDYGTYSVSRRCTFSNFTFSNVQDITADGQVRITITDGVPNSCEGDPQLDKMKIYSLE